MKPELKQKWVEALRSGKYKQCVNELYDGVDKFCALGLLGYIDGQQPWVERGAELPPSWYITEIGMTVEQREQVIEQNDQFMKSFPEIAEFIERNL